MQKNIKKVHHPHNNIFVKWSKIKEVVEALINGLTTLRGELEPGSFQLENTTWFDKYLSEGRGDVLYSAKWKGTDAYIYILFEHKSYLENFFVQLFYYLGVAYYQQKMDIIAENKARKEQELPPNKRDLQPIIAVILYHGERNFVEKEFADVFHLPDERLKDFIPKVKYILIDLNVISDEDLLNLGNSLLSAMLLVFKHKGNKEFIKQNTKKIFKFVEDRAVGGLTEDMLSALVLYIYQTFNFKPEEVKEILPELPPKAKEEMISTFDLIEQRGIEIGKEEGIQIGEQRGIEIGKEEGIQIGEQRGIEIGKEEGIQIGEQIAKIKKNLEFTAELLKKLPNWSDKEIADTAKVSLKFVQKIRKKFNKNKEEKIVKLARQLFKEVPNIGEKDLTELKKWTLEVWKAFKKK